MPHLEYFESISYFAISTRYERARPVFNLYPRVIMLKVPSLCFRSYFMLNWELLLRHVLLCALLPYVSRPMYIPLLHDLIQ